MKQYKVIVTPDAEEDLIDFQDICCNIGYQLIVMR